MINKKAFSLVSVIAVAMGLFAMVASSPVLLAHDEHGRGYRYNAYEQGQSVGYQYGFQHGQNDRYARIGYNLDSREYRRASIGYDPRFGSWFEYRRGFRAGYEAGYNAGFNSRRGWDGNRRDWDSQRRDWDSQRRGWRSGGYMYE